METLIVQPKNQKQLDAVEAVLKALNVAFKKEEEKKSSYDKKFVEKIERSRKEIEEGNYITIDPSKSLWDNIL